MTTRKKPCGLDWEQFAEAWNKANHEEKVALAKKYDVTYDTAKHWCSEGDTTRITPDDADGTQEAINYVLAIPWATQLDFAIFDIETSNLTADFSILLTACIKPFGQEATVFRFDDYPEWAFNRADDHLIVEDVVKELSQHAVIVTHYGSGFDIPYLRAKCGKYRIPALPPMFGVDTYRIAKDAFRVSSRRLKALATYFELGHKENVEGGLWMEAALNGSKEAMDVIVKHNIQDTIVLEKLASMSFPYMRSLRRL